MHQDSNISRPPVEFEPLPVDAHVPEIVALVRSKRAVIVTAAAGAGKTTRVPPALVADGPVLLLQPRRVAVRATAQRIASEQRWTVGREVGWHVRFDRRESTETRLLVATEGMLTARLQQDPLLSGFRTIVLDEFHERNIHSDLGLALARQAWAARDDLRIVVMSATLDAQSVSAFLDHCPTLHVPGRLYPVEIGYRAAADAPDVVASELPGNRGAVLVFLPGAREIGRAATRLAAVLPPEVPVLELHGGVEAARQDAALSPSNRPRVILATNIAETTLTVPDVTLVVDAGWQKVSRYDESRGIDSLVTERVSRDAADQRAGRAGRVAPGRALRLWDEHARLRPHRIPDIARVDLAGPALDVLAWGADPRTFEWFEPPRRDALESAMDLLGRLGALDAGGHLSALGRRMQRLPLHPRLARLLIEAGGAPEAVRVVVLLSERRRWHETTSATTCDIRSALESDDAAGARGTRRLEHDLQSAYARSGNGTPSSAVDDDRFRGAVLAGYPDRVGRRRAPGSDRFLLASGTGARLGRSSGVVNPEFIVAVDVHASSAGSSGDATIRAATGIERDWLAPTEVSVEHTFDSAAGVVRASRIERYGALVLSTVDVPIDAGEATRLMATALMERGPQPADQLLLARLRSAGVPLTFEHLARQAAQVARRIDEVTLADHVPHDLSRKLLRDAPADLLLPSGRRVPLQYHDDGRIVASVKLQELFGLAETPRVGLAGAPVTFELLAPNGRPVQVTSDLRSFWTHGYREVRRELRARYPRHPWPEDPWTAQPTHRTIRRR